MINFILNKLNVSITKRRKWKRWYRTNFLDLIMLVIDAAILFVLLFEMWRGR